MSSRPRAQTTKNRGHSPGLSSSLQTSVSNTSFPSSNSPTPLGQAPSSRKLGELVASPFAGLPAHRVVAAHPIDPEDIYQSLLDATTVSKAINVVDGVVLCAADETLRAAVANTFVNTSGAMDAMLTVVRKFPQVSPAFGIALSYLVTVTSFAASFLKVRASVSFLKYCAVDAVGFAFSRSIIASSGILKLFTSAEGEVALTAFVNSSNETGAVISAITMVSTLLTKKAKMPSNPQTRPQLLSAILSKLTNVNATALLATAAQRMSDFQESLLVFLTAASTDEPTSALKLCLNFALEALSTPQGHIDPQAGGWLNLLYQLNVPARTLGEVDLPLLMAHAAKMDCSVQINTMFLHLAYKWKQMGTSFDATKFSVLHALVRPEGEVNDQEVTMALYLAMSLIGDSETQKLLGAELSVPKVEGLLKMLGPKWEKRIPVHKEDGLHGSVLSKDGFNEKGTSGTASTIGTANSPDSPLKQKKRMSTPSEQSPQLVHLQMLWISFLHVLSHMKIYALAPLYSPLEGHIQDGSITAETFTQFTQWPLNAENDEGLMKKLKSFIESVGQVESATMERRIATKGHEEDERQCMKNIFDEQLQIFLADPAYAARLEMRRRAAEDDSEKKKKEIHDFKKLSAKIQTHRSEREKTLKDDLHRTRDSAISTYKAEMEGIVWDPDELAMKQQGHQGKLTKMQKHYDKQTHDLGVYAHWRLQLCNKIGSVLEVQHQRQNKELLLLEMEEERARGNGWISRPQWWRSATGSLIAEEREAWRNMFHAHDGMHLPTPPDSPQPLLSVPVPQGMGDSMTSLRLLYRNASSSHMQAISSLSSLPPGSRSPKHTDSPKNALGINSASPITTGGNSRILGGSLPTDSAASSNASSVTPVKLPTLLGGVEKTNPLQSPLPRISSIHSRSGSMGSVPRSDTTAGEGGILHSPPENCILHSTSSDPLSLHGSSTTDPETLQLSNVARLEETKANKLGAAFDESRLKLCQAEQTWFEYHLHCAIMEQKMVMMKVVAIDYALFQIGFEEGKRRLDVSIEEGQSRVRLNVTAVPHSLQPASPGNSVGGVSSVPAGDPAKAGERDFLVSLKHRRARERSQEGDEPPDKRMRTRVSSRQSRQADYNQAIANQLQVQAIGSTSPPIEQGTEEQGGDLTTSTNPLVAEEAMRAKVQMYEEQWRDYIIKMFAHELQVAAPFMRIAEIERQYRGFVEADEIVFLHQIQVFRPRGRRYRPIRDEPVDEKNTLTPAGQNRIKNWQRAVIYGTDDPTFIIEDNVPMTAEPDDDELLDEAPRRDEAGKDQIRSSPVRSMPPEVSENSTGTGGGRGSLVGSTPVGSTPPSGGFPDSNAGLEILQPKTDVVPQTTVQKPGVDYDKMALTMLTTYEAFSRDDIQHKLDKDLHRMYLQFNMISATLVKRAGVKTNPNDGVGSSFRTSSRVHLSMQAGSSPLSPLKSGGF